MQGERRFHHQVDEGMERVAAMARLARESLYEGVEAFTALDAGRARRVVAMDDALNRTDVEIEAFVLDLLARNQPMAVDLRRLGACLKIITYLDRIGRYGYDVAKSTLALEGKSHLVKPVAIPLMRDKALGMLDLAMEAFTGANADFARRVGGLDDEVDALYDQVFRECLTYMMEDPRNITVCTRVILVARHLERVADNAAKIAEKTLYMLTGKRRLDLAASGGAA